MQFVALGQDVQLTATIPKKFKNYQNADLDLKLNHGITTESLVNTEVRLTRGKGTHTWTATGLTAAELSAIVDVTWTGRGMWNKTVTQKVFVHRTEVVLHAVDGDDRPVANAAYELTMRVHPQYTGPVAQVPLTGQANGGGRAVISNLPPLESLEVRWKNPNLLSDTGWVTGGNFTEDGAQRKAVLRAGYRAQLVGVAANDSLTQYVNVPLDLEDERAGPLIRIRAKVHNDDGGGSRGDRIWARVVWGDNNCTRTDKAPKLEAEDLVAAAGRGETQVVVHKQLGADKGEVTFTFDCGVAGCDQFSLWVGGDPAAEDDGPVHFETMRKLRLEPYFPPDYAHGDRLFSSGFKQKLKLALAVAGIELEVADPQTATYRERLSGGTPPPRRVSAEICEQLGLGREVHYIFDHDRLKLCLPMAFQAAAAYPTVRAFYADKLLVFGSVGHPFKSESMTSRTSEWITSGANSGFMPCDLDGGSMLAPYSEAVPAKDVYEEVYLWDEVTKQFPTDGARDKAQTHVWAVDTSKLQTKKEQYSGEDFLCHVAKLIPEAEAKKSRRKIVSLIDPSGIPQGYEWLTYGFAKRTLKETIARVPEVWGEWRTKDGQHGQITMEHIEIDMNEDKFMRFRFKLPEQANPSPDNPATATVGLRTVSSPIAGESGGCALMQLNDKGDASDKAAYVFLHELGHSLGQSWSSIAKPPPGVVYDKKYLYGWSGPRGSNRGHQGSHCAYGLADEYLDNKLDYSDLLTKKGIHGVCVMFGGVGPRTVYTDQTRQFCPKCLPTIKSQDLSKIGGGAL